MHNNSRNDRSFLRQIFFTDSLTWGFFHVKAKKITFTNILVIYFAMNSHLIVKHLTDPISLKYFSQRILQSPLLDDCDKIL